MNAEKARARRIAATHRDTIGALTLAMPPALAMWFNALSHCMEASVVGARILRDTGIEARVVPCAVRAYDESTHYLTAGYTRSEIAALAGRDADAIEYHGRGVADDKGFHVVIEAQPVTGRTIIDLTLGQLLANAQTLVVPIENGWPAVQLGKWRVDYDPSPRAGYVEEQIVLANAVAYDGLRGDVDGLMVLAKACHCDKESFYSSMLAQNREATMQFLRVAERGLPDCLPATAQ